MTKALRAVKRARRGSQQEAAPAPAPAPKKVAPKRAAPKKAAAPKPRRRTVKKKEVDSE